MSMHSDYVRERLGDEIIERQEGFITYRYLDDCGVSSVYIVDIFVRSDFRKSKFASEMADEVVRKAKDCNGCKRLIGTVSPSAKNATDSLKVLLGYGMELYRCANDVIVFKKEI